VWAGILPAMGKRTTETGYKNRNRQVVVRPTHLAGTDHNQYVYVLRCGDCGHEYGANGSDIREHYEAFRSAINELREAAQLAYTFASDPTAATQSRFEEYDRHVNEAAVRLERSNEILGRNYKTIEGVQRVSPL
jgi:hypothetical protein